MLITKDLGGNYVNDLKREIKELIISSLELEGLTENDIPDDELLFDPDGLGLDSVDALELGIALKKKFGVPFDSKADENKERFKSVNTLSEYVRSKIEEKNGN